MITVKYDWADDDFTTYGIEEQFETWGEAAARKEELVASPYAEHIEIIDERY